jgi:hypothetical protein
MNTRTASDYPFGIFWSLYCLSFDLRLLITPFAFYLLSHEHTVSHLRSIYPVSVYFLRVWLTIPQLPLIFLCFSQEEFEDTTLVIKISKSKKDRQHIGQKIKSKQRLQETTQKTNHRATRTPLKIDGELRCSERRRLLKVTLNAMIINLKVHDFWWIIYHRIQKLIWLCMKDP